MKTFSLLVAVLFGVAETNFALASSTEDARFRAAVINTVIYTQRVMANLDPKDGVQRIAGQVAEYAKTQALDLRNDPFAFIQQLAHHNIVTESNASALEALVNQSAVSRVNFATDNSYIIGLTVVLGVVTGMMCIPLAFTNQNPQTAPLVVVNGCPANTQSR